MSQEMVIKEFILKHASLDFEESDFDNDDNIFSLGIINSLFAMTLVTFIEQQFNISIEIEDLDINNFSSINKLSTFVKSKEQE